jgi:hypothetical protein
VGEPREAEWSCCSKPWTAKNCRYCARAITGGPSHIAVTVSYRLYHKYFNLHLCPSPNSPQAPVVIVVAEAAAREAGGRAADATNG